MSLTPSFVITNNSGVNQALFTIADTSLGSDIAIFDRVVIINKSDGTQLGANLDFPLAAGSSITYNVLDKDYAVSITLNWVDSGGVVLYTANNIFVFTGYLLWFYYSLIQNLAALPNLTNDQNFLDNVSKFETLIDSANQSINVGQSVFNAQNMVNAAQYMIANQSNLF